MGWHSEIIKRFSRLSSEKKEKEKKETESSKAEKLEIERLLLNIEKRNNRTERVFSVVTTKNFSLGTFSYADLETARERKRERAGRQLGMEELQFLAGLITGRVNARRIITRDTTASLSRLASVQL